MNKNIDEKNKIAYMPSQTTGKVVFNNTGKKQLFVDDKYKYKKNAFVRFFQCLTYYCIAQPAFYIYGKLGLGVKVINKDKIKNIKTGAVTVSNHCHYLDFSIATTFIKYGKRSHVISNRDNFDIPFVGHLISLYGVMPLPDTPKAGMNFYKQIGEYLDKKRFIHIFPEAAMWPYYNKLRPFKSGAFHFATMYDVPVIPYVLVFRKVTGIRRLFRKKPVISAVICDPVYANPNLKKKEKINDLCERVHKEMEEMLEKYNSYPYYEYKPLEEEK